MVHHAVYAALGLLSVYRPNVHNTAVGYSTVKWRN